MDHHPAHPASLTAVDERAPLTRARARVRQALAAATGRTPTTSPLPNVEDWSELFQGPPVSAAEAAALNRVAQVGTVSQGSLVFSRQQVAQSVVWVSQGDVALGVHQGDGSFRIEQHLHGPAWLDASAGWLCVPHAQDAQALSTATVVHLPCAALRAVFERAPALSQRMVVSLAREVRGLALASQALLHQDAPARLAAWLMALCRPAGPEAIHGQVALPMRKRDIASQLAITPETLSRLMRSLADQGVIRVEGYTVHVLDIPALARRSR